MFFIDNELLFGSFTNLFILGWLLIAAATFFTDGSPVRTRLLLVGGRIIPLVLLTLFVVGWLLTRQLPGEITSLQGVLTSYAVPEKVLIAWFEILGLALLVARWMVEDAAAENQPRLILLVGLIGTFFAAPIGIIGFLLLSRSWQRIRSA